MIPGLDVAGCALLVLTIDPSFDGIGWRERVDLELAGPGCDRVTLTLPDGVELTEARGRVLVAGAPDHALPAEHLVRRGITREGVRTVDLLLPAFDEGDVARLRLERTWTRPVDLVVAPGLGGARYAEVRTPRGIEHRVTGLQAERRSLWAADPPAEARVVLLHPWAERGPPTLPPAASWASVDDAHARLAALTLVPSAWFGRSPVLGDAAIALGALDDRGFARTLAAWAPAEAGVEVCARVAPGDHPSPGGAEVAVAWAPGAAPRPWPHPDDPLGDGVLQCASGEVVVTPSASGAPQDRARVLAATVELRLAGRHPFHGLGPTGEASVVEQLTLGVSDEGPWTAWLALPADTRAVGLVGDCDHARLGRDVAWLASAGAACVLEVTRPALEPWGRPLAPPTSPPRVVWTRDDGSVVTEELARDGEAWRLATLDGREVVPGLDTVAEVLEDRFLRAVLPEPGVPLRVRGGREGWELASSLRGLLAHRARVIDLPALDPLRPRPLVRARRGRGLTPVEAAMVMAAYGRQQKLDTDWGVAARALGPDAEPTPMDLRDGLVRVRHEDGEAWIDAGCEVCAPFELRAGLHGARVLGPAGPRVPLPRVEDGLPAGIARAEVGWTWAGGDGRAGVGGWQVDDLGVGEQVTWTLAGADALALRVALAAERGEARRAELEAHVAPSGGRLAGIEGLAEAGAPLTLALADARAFAVDPLDLPAGAQLPGLRTWRRAAPPGALPARFATDDPGCGAAPDHPVAWQAWIEGDVLTEQVLVRTTRLDPADLEGLARCRRAALAAP